MSIAKKISQADESLDSASVDRLVDLYDRTIEDLRQCANADPSLEADNENADLREAALLDFEASLLDQAARVQLRTKSDVEALMDIWAKSSGIFTGECANPSDRIAMNIFRHMSDAQFTKD